MQTNLTLDWADGSYDFKLTWAGAAEVERKSDAAIQVVYERIMVGSGRLADVVEIIRQGLLGGGGGIVDEQPVECKPPLVNQLIERYVTGPDRPPFIDSWTVAKVIIHTFMVGYEPAQKKSEDDELGEELGETPPNAST